MSVFVHALVSEISVSASKAFSYLLALFGLFVLCLFVCAFIFEDPVMSRVMLLYDMNKHVGFRRTFLSLFDKLLVHASLTSCSVGVSFRGWAKKSMLAS